MASFPTAAIGFAETELHKTNNLGSSVASGGPYSDSATTISVADASAGTTWPTANFVCLVEDTGELFFVTSRSGNDLTVATRGFGGTTADGISDGDAISVVRASEAIQAVNDELVAIEDVLLGGTQADLTIDGSLTLDDTTGSGDLTVAGAAIFNGSGTFNGTLVLPTAAAPTPTAEGEIWWDSDDDVLRVGDGAATIEIGSTAGFVDAAGTPADNQLAVFTDADTIEGDANLTWDGSTLAVTGEATVSGASTLTGDVTLQQPDQDYVVSGGSGIYANDLVLTGQTADTAAGWSIVTADSDGTEFANMRVWAVGSPSSATNRELVQVGWDAGDDSFQVEVLAAGTGTARPLKLLTDGNTNQLVLATDGNVGIGTNNPGEALEVNGNIRFADVTGGGAQQNQIIIQNSGNTGDSIAIVNSTSGNVNAEFFDNGDTHLRFPNTTTGTGLVVATNDDSLQEIQRDSSTARDKDMIQAAAIDPRAVLSIQPKRYKRKNSDTTMIGFVVEDFHDAGFHDILGYDPEGRPAAFKEFGRGITALHHEVLRWQDTRIEALERACREHGIPIPVTAS